MERIVHWFNGFGENMETPLLATFEHDGVHYVVTTDRIGKPIILERAMGLTPEIIDGREIHFA